MKARSKAVALIGSLSLAGAFAFVKLDVPANSAGQTVAPGTLSVPGGTSPKLPVFMIDVGRADITQKTRTRGTLKVIEDHDGTLKDLPARPVSAQSAIAIEIRGATS